MASTRSVRTSLAVEGSPVPVGDGLSLAAYRVVQESLTNAGKHAPGGAADVRVAWAPDALRVTARSTDGAAGGEAPAGSGYGLRSMAERVRSYGGDFAAGPDGPAFEVSATFPLEILEGRR